MDSLDDHEVLINLPLFKMLHFIDMFNSRCSKIVYYNAYRFIATLFTVTIQSILIFGLLGFFVSTDLIDSYDELTIVITVHIYILNYVCLLKTSFLIYNSDSIWTLLNITSIHYLSSLQCAKYTGLLRQYHKYPIILSNIYFFFALSLSFIWILYPLALNVIMIKSGVTNESYVNVFNFLYPVNIYTYNKYFFIFYIIEIIQCIFFLYFMTMFNTFFVSITYAFVAQYNVLFEAFKNIIHNQTPSKSKSYKISITYC